MNSGWVKLYRNMQQWEWKASPKHVAIFVDILLEANHSARRYRGIDVPAGSLTTSLKAISGRTGVSIRSVRTVLNDLKSTREVTIKTTSKYTMISITKWCEYQSTDTINDKQVTNKRQTSDKQVTTNKNERIEELKNLEDVEEEGRQQKPNALKITTDHVLKSWEKLGNRVNNFHLTRKQVHKLIDLNSALTLEQYDQAIERLRLDTFFNNAENKSVDMILSEEVLLRTFQKENQIDLRQRMEYVED